MNSTWERRRLACSPRQRPLRYVAGETPAVPGIAVAGVDEELRENDVHYGIADCRRRLRSQRSTFRAQHHPPKGELYEPSPEPAPLEEREEAVIT
jgi:hypothetical protein